MLVLIALTSTVLLIFLLGLFGSGGKGARRAARIPADPSRPIPDPPPLVSILVPARNEEANLDTCLASLRAQDYPSLEIVVVDDRSNDRTPSILARHAAEDPRIVPVRGEEPPEGWFGKPNAIRAAAAAAKGEWLLMTDADTVHVPSAVRSALGWTIDQGAAGLSLLPRAACHSFWAKLIAPQLGALLVAGRSFRRINDPTSDAVFGNGAYFLVRRDAYERAGGIAAVKDIIDEDVAFARALKNAGLGYRFADGESLYTQRLYTTLREFFEGFGKNIFSTLDRSLSKLAKVTALLWVFSLAPISTAVVSILSLAIGVPAVPGSLAATGLAEYASILVVQSAIRRRAGFPAWMSVLAPLGGMLVWSIIAYSAWQSLTGRAVSWKGRRYKAKPI